MPVLRSPPRYTVIKTGSPMAGCPIGMCRKTNFGQAKACSLVGQSMVISNIIL